MLKITPAGVVSTFATIASPGGLTADGQGNLFVLNYACPGVLYKITPAGVMSAFGTGLCHSDDVAVGPNGDLFINDRGTQRIMRVPAAGGAASVFATGIGLSYGLEFDSTGQLFVANYSRGIIYKIDTNGSVSPFMSGFYVPTGLVFDQQDKLYITDMGNNKVVRVDDELPVPTATPSPTATPTTTPSPTATATVTPSPTVTATPTSVPPPTADGLTINGGALTTTSIDVQLDVSASNAEGGQAGLSMSFSNDGANWSDWQDYAASSPWQLTSGNGQKTVYGRFKNSGGALSAIVSDTIKLDTGLQSEYSVTINNGAIYTNKVAVQLKISAKPGTAEMQISNDGGFIGAEWEPYSSHKAWQITRYRDQTVTRVVYVRFRDVAGNVSGLYLDDIILDPDKPHGHVAITGQGLDLTATDGLSGIADMRLSDQPTFENAAWEPFSSSRTWDFASSPAVFVQFRDEAGNESPTYSASLGQGSTVFLPFVTQ